MNLKYEFSIQEVADKYVAMAKNRESGTVELVFNLNATGALLLQALQDGKDVPSIAALLSSEYDIQPEESRQEVLNFIDTLADNGLLQV